jgi:hypothetical protein
MRLSKVERSCAKPTRMTRGVRSIRFIAPVLAVIGSAAVAGALSNVVPGVWEITGAPGAKSPAKACFPSLDALTQYEHRASSCSRKVLTDAGNSLDVQYSCGGSGFGRSQLKVITPRSLRIETQGISDGLPFHYVLQARRVGDCDPK